MDINRHHPLSRKAAKLYREGKYKLAREAYADLQQRYGEEMFWVNVYLCDRRMATRDTKTSRRESRKTKLRIACILDEFSFASFSQECEAIQLESGIHISQLANFKPDILLVESAWLGHKGSWEKQVAHNSKSLRSAIDWCNSNETPTAFWNKEDPVHYQTFLTTAQQFDVVFTTDIDCVPSYKHALGHNRVFFLPFSCNPKQLGPTEKYERKHAFSFAGAYYTKYPERVKDLENFLRYLPSLLPLDIFDRNHGKNDSRYMFPEEYQQYIIGSLPFAQIERAYNGYMYSLNLNSVKQSQSMFARRVFDLLATNTLVVSNYSRGMRVIFGDLCVTTDDPKIMIRRIKDNLELNDLIRLQGLRKVLEEFTSRSSLEYIHEKLLGIESTAHLANVAVFATADNDGDLINVLENYCSQTLSSKTLYITYTGGTEALNRLGSHLDLEDVHILTQNRLKTQLKHLVEDKDWVSVMNPPDYWGKNYLKDLVLASLYTDSGAIGKTLGLQVEGSSIAKNNCSAYRAGQSIVASSSILKTSCHTCQILLELISAPNTVIKNGYAIDPYNYFPDARGTEIFDLVKDSVDDIKIDTGLSLKRLREIIDAQPPQRNNVIDSSLTWDSDFIFDLFKNSSRKSINIRIQPDGSLEVSSSRPERKHDYLYSHLNISTSDFPVKEIIHGYFDIDPGLDVMFGFRFIDNSGNIINTSMAHSGRNFTASIPEETAYIKPCIRISGSGITKINCFTFSHCSTTPPVIISKSKVLLVINRYPSYDNLYSNAFVHARIKKYKELGFGVEVFQVCANQPLSYREFENIDIISGDYSDLRLLLESSQHEAILVHFLNSQIWDIIKYADNTIKLIWAHGSDIQLSHRRKFLYSSDESIKKATERDLEKRALWADVLAQRDDVQIVFVSSYLADQVLLDYRIDKNQINFSVINNPIDTNLFAYTEKPLEQRKRILSIRPYTSSVYANDLSVKAILSLSREPFFEDLDFLIIGDGMLFDETLASIKDFPNVEIRKQFLRTSEIAALHKDYGIFLVPTRMDTQGVSRDEAMSSGLVPITNNVAAIPEFVDSTCCCLAADNDSQGLANAIKELYYNPDKFSKMSRNAAIMVRSRPESVSTAKAEIELISKCIQPFAKSVP